MRALDFEAECGFRRNVERQTPYILRPSLVAPYLHTIMERQHSGGERSSGILNTILDTVPHAGTSFGLLMAPHPIGQSGLGRRTLVIDDNLNAHKGATNLIRIAIGLAEASIASTSRTFLMICSGLCRFRFIENLLPLWGARDSRNTWTSFLGAGHARISLGFFFVALVVTGNAWGAVVSVFDNDAYVDTEGGTFTTESNTVQASLSSLGYTVSTFTGITAADWTTAGDGGNCILIPELENGDLAIALSAPAKSAIASFVSSGGGLIVHGSEYTSGSPRMGSLLNTVFGFSLVETSETTSSTSVLTGAAAGTAFAGGPTPIPNYNGTSSFLSGMPGGASEIYENSINTNTTVALIPFGSGRIIYLGWDWFNAVPLGGADGGWLNVLDRAVIQAKVPEPATFALAAFGVAALAACGWRRR